MQVPNAIIMVVAEFTIVLIFCTVFLFIHTRKLKSLLRRQQDKLVGLLKATHETPTTPKPLPVAPSPPVLTPTQNYKAYLNKELDATAAQFAILSPEQDISLELPQDSPDFQKILALRYAFLRAEELGTTEDTGTEEYWNIFQQALAPLLSTSSVDNNELETANKRIENLEKFKRLFFEMEKQWTNAQANAQNYYAQLQALSAGVHDQDGFRDVLDKYHGVYDEIHHNIVSINQNPDAAPEYKTINITRQDPRAAEEIMKLRNVAADQHRIINQLQRKLTDAKTSEEKERVIIELQQQLQRQIRFVQESESCVQVLELELDNLQQELSKQEQYNNGNVTLNEENQRIKNTLHNFSLESKELMNTIEELEKENSALRQNVRVAPIAAPTAAAPAASAELKKAQAELLDLKKQYAELEEKYLDLKLGS